MLKTRLLTPILLIVFNLNAFAQTLPISHLDGDLKPLRTLVDAKSQTELVNTLSAKKKWKSLISQKKLCVGLVDLQDLTNVKYSSVNGEYMMYAASLPKIAVLLAAMDAAEKGEIEETDQVKNDLRLMISNSDNAASTRMIDLLGFDKINGVLTDPQYNFYDEENGGGLWVGKRYAKTGSRKPDPLKGLSHAASATRYAGFTT